MLDQSFSAIEVTSQDQFAEIMRVHSIVKQERMVPRFLCYIADHTALQSDLPLINSTDMRQSSWKEIV